MTKNRNLITISKNTFSLLILQGTTLIIPLILLPYLVRTLGIELFGLISFAIATVSFFRGIVAYGFDLSGTRLISIFRNNKIRLKTVFSSIFFVRLILTFISFLVLLLLIALFDKFEENWLIFILTFLIVFGDVLFPIYFFQGIEKMAFITYLRLIHKLLFLFLVISFVKERDDYILVPLFDSIGSIIVGFISLYIIKKKYGITLSKVKFIHIIYQLKNSWHIFISKIMVILYTSLNIFVLGVITNNTIVGIYSIADKIYQAIRSLLNPVIQAIFPYLAALHKKNKNAYLKFVKKFNIYYILILILFFLITFFFSSEIIHLVSGKEIKEANNILKILSIGLIFSIGSFYSTLLVIKSQNKILSKITLIIMSLNLIFVVPTIYYFNITGLATMFISLQIIQSFYQVKYNKEIWKKYVN